MNQQNAIKIAFLGDITPGGLLAYEGQIEEEIRDYLSHFDYRIATCETAFGDGSTLCPIKTKDSSLFTIIYSPKESVHILKELNINAVTLANNHSCDCGLNGLYDTINILTHNKISTFGAGRNIQEASNPLVITIKGKSLCFLGYYMDYFYLYKKSAYNPSDNTGGINKFKFDNVLTEVKKYKTLYDYVFVMPHWGTEQSIIPKDEEINYAKRLIDAGADGIIGSHSHIVQPVWKYKGKIIAMNLGNFLFPDRYICPPRVTYYPTKEELSQISPVPVVQGFPFVKQISLKKCSKKNRIGAILEVEVGEDIDFKLTLTKLHSHHILKLQNNLSLYKLSILYLSAVYKLDSKLGLKLYFIFSKTNKLLKRYYYVIKNKLFKKNTRKTENNSNSQSY